MLKMLQGLNHLNGRNIAISGVPGSGKSTVVKLLQQILGYDVLSAGSVFRDKARELGISLAELNASDTTQLDHQVDTLIQEKTSERDRYIVDSRFSAKFAQNAFKVFLYCRLDEAERRISTAGRVEETRYTINLHERMTVESHKALDLYQFNPYDLSNYDLIIDTTNLRPEEVVPFILQAEEDVIISKESLYPTQHIRDLNENILKNALLIDPAPITVTFKDYHFLIVDGHHRWINTCKLNVPFIRCSLVNADNLSICCQADYDALCGIDRSIIE